MFLVCFLSEYQLFAVMLTSRTLQAHQQLFGTSSSQITPEDWRAVKDTFMRFDAVVHVLKALPTSMLLILRSVLHCVVEAACPMLLIIRAVLYRLVDLPIPWWNIQCL